MFAFVALFLVLIVGAGAAYWAVKKYKEKQRQEFRFEGTMGKAREGFDKEEFKTAVMADELLDQVIEKHQLLAVWGSNDTAAAKARLRTKFTITLEGQTVKVGYQDKNKELAKAVLQSIVQGYYEKVNGGRKVPSTPSSPPAPPSP